MKFVPFYSHRTHALPTQTFAGEFCKVFKNNYYVEHQQTAASEKTISY